MEQLREAERLVGQQLEETAARAQRVEGELAETKGELEQSRAEVFGAREDLEAAKKRSEDLKGSIVQLMDRLEVQQVQELSTRTVHPSLLCTVLFFVSGVGKRSGDLEVA